MFMFISSYIFFSVGIVLKEYFYSNIFVDILGIY